MQLSRPLLTILISVVLLFTLGACAQDVSRNADGSLKLETALNHTAVLDMVDVALVDTAIDVEALQLQHGFVQLQGDCDVGGGAKQPVEIRMEFDVVDGALVTRITEASVHNAPISRSTITTWNEAIAARSAGNSAEDSGRELEYVTVTPEEVCLTWRVERPPNAGQ